MEKKYEVQGHILTLRETATYKQVANALKLMGELEVDENTSFPKLVNELAAQGETLFTDTIFYYEPNARQIKWDEVPFDTIVDMVQDFLSSSTYLSALVKKFGIIFQSLDRLAELAGVENTGTSSDGLEATSNSTAPAAETISPPSA